MAVKVFIIHTLYIIIFLLMFAVWFLKEFKYKICSLSWMIQLHNLQNVIIKSWCYCNLRYSYFPEENSSVFLYKEQCHKMCFLVSISFWSQNAHILSSMGSHFYSFLPVSILGGRMPHQHTAIADLTFYGLFSSTYSSTAYWSLNNL